MLTAMGLSSEYNQFKRKLTEHPKAIETDDPSQDGKYIYRRYLDNGEFVTGCILTSRFVFVARLTS